MIVWLRLLIGFVVLICTEVFSGASVAQGLWHPWTWVVTFWLYFAHFFLFTTLAVRTGRTSLASLYLWGVLFGLYESWITKVIWHGYEATYLYLRPDGLPSVWVQLATLALYAVPVTGLWMDRRREPEPGLEVQVTKGEWRRVLWAFGLVLGMGLVLSVPWFRHGAQVFSMGALVLWTPLGFVLAGAAWWRCWRGLWLHPNPRVSTRSA